MKKEDIKINDVVTITRQNKKYTWSSYDELGIVQGIKGNRIVLLKTNGKTDEVEYHSEETEEHGATEINLAGDYLFLEKIDEHIERCVNDLKKAEEEIKRVTKFKHTFTDQLSLFARIKTLFNIR